MSKIVGDSACPQCKSMGRDKSSNHLIHFEDGGRHCNRCGYTVKPNGTIESEEYEDNMKWNQYTVADVLKLPVGSDPKRKVGKETNEHFRTRVEYNTVTGEVDKVFYPYIKEGKAVGYKVRKHFEEGDREVEGKPELLGVFKCFRAIGDVKGVLYNQHQSGRGGKRLLIVEGEEDAAAAYEMLSKYNPKVVSIPSGATINKEDKGVLDKGILENKDYLDSFEEICCCFDEDKAGAAITAELAALLGPKVKHVRMSEKDASDMLTKGKQAEFVNAYFKAEQWRPNNIVTVNDVWEQATAVPVYGRQWPWPTLTKLTYGRRGGEGIYVGAGVKVGKTEFLTQMIHHIIYTEGLPIFGAKFEQNESLTFQTIAGKKDRIAYHNPDTYITGKATKQTLEQAIASIGDKVHLFKAGYSDAGQGGLWERLKQAIRYEVITTGVKDVFIDPITQLTDGMTASDTETYLRKFSNEMQALAQELDFFYYIFCHLKEPSQGTPHEEGGRVKAAQFRGSRAMAEKTKYLLGIERNITAEDETERNTSTFRLLLNSGFGRSGSFTVMYDPETTDYLEPNHNF